MDRNTIKPTLMQLAEPEYMCECGYKLYVYPQNKKPTKCCYCGRKFDWSDYCFGNGNKED